MGNDSVVRRFLKQAGHVRMLVIMVVLVGLFGMIVVDVASDFWDDIPFLTNIVSTLLLAILTALLVEGYVSFRSAETWKRVAAYGLQDLGRVARDVWANVADLLEVEPDPLPVEEYRRRLGTEQGRRNHTRAAEAVVADPVRLAALFTRLSALGSESRDVVVRWAATLVARDELAERLDEFTALQRDLLDLLGVLAIAGQEQSTVDVRDLGGRVVGLVEKAVALDDALTAASTRIEQGSVRQ